MLVITRGYHVLTLPPTALRYDFFYLPRDVKFRANLGYAFINFVTPEDGARVWTV